MPQTNENGKLTGIVSAVKSLTLTNALVIILLILAIGPAYIGYRLLNDSALLDKFLSYYKVTSSQMLPCNVIQARQRGEHYTWAITTGFAFEGGTRWSIGVTMDHEPGNEEIANFCEALLLIVDHMRNPDGVDPKFPGTNKEIIQEYK